MALIKCEECGQMVSDKAAACPHCGCPMQSQNESVDSCPECGHSVPKTASICPNCGYPVEKMRGSSEEAYQEMYRYDFDPDEEPSHSKHRIIWAIVALVVPLALFGIYWLSELGYFDSSSNKEPVDDSAVAEEQVLPDSVCVEEAGTDITSTNPAEGSVSSASSSSQWRITSVEQLKGKLDGTIWTCRPTGRMWYRLVFSSGKMRLYYAQPSSGKWHGGDDNHVYIYQIKEGYTNDTGEKYIGVAFGKDMDDIFAWGTLAFFPDGDVLFDWLRGQEGGKAVCGDFNWE